MFLMDSMQVIQVLPVSSDADKIFGGWVVEGTSDDISTKVITSDTVFEATFISKPTNDLYVISSIARKINDGEIDYDITIQNNGSDVVKIWSLSANVGFAFDQLLPLKLRKFQMIRFVDLQRTTI